MNNKECTNFGFKNIYSLLSKPLAENPGAPCVRFEDLLLTYQELHEKSNQLANYLIRMGVSPGKVVGLNLLNHPNLIIAILAILKAGGVYLPLDHEHQESHLNYILQDANPSLIITESKFVSRFDPLTYKTFSIDTDTEWEKETTDFHELPIHSQQVAYIVYTSGSTGNPKGIMLTHDSMPHFLVSRNQFYLKNPISLLLGSIGFDASILTIFHTLAFGGQICLPNNENKINIDEINSTINKLGVNFILCVPSLYLAMLKRAQPLPSLKQVSLAGENLPNHIPLLHAKIAPNSMLYNEYGPSEYAIGGTLATIFDGKDGKIHEITIGKPLKDILIYILDEDLNICPTGVKGEIFIGGPGLAKGYLNKQSLTDEKFPLVSINNEPSIRLYRTGDFGRLQANGDIEFLGRIDYQVKILGYRVELGAIEYHVSQFTGINEVAVIVQEYSFEEKKIIAYFSSYHEINIQDLRTFLTTKLPKHMIPSLFVHMSEFPLTPNGKIDRRALPEPKEESSKQILNEPCSELEKKLLKIWKMVLKSESVSIYDTFFDAGGNSILILDVQEFIKEELNIDTKITDLFQFPTISQLAKHLETSSLNCQASEPKQEKRTPNFNKFKKPKNT